MILINMSNSGSINIAKDPSSNGTSGVPDWLWFFSFWDPYTSAMWILQMWRVESCIVVKSKLYIVWYTIFPFSPPTSSLLMADKQKNFTDSSAFLALTNKRRFSCNTIYKGIVSDKCHLYVCHFEKCDNILA